MAYFPFMIEIGDKKCLVAGGGSIAFHKVKILADFGVQIQVVAPKICEPLRKLAEERILQKECEKTGQKDSAGHDRQQKGCNCQIECEEREFQEQDIYGMDFVVAATDDEEMNYHISDLCRQRSILVNVVDVKDACSFIFPAIIKDKDMLISVSSGGQSPAAAAYVKKKIRQGISDYYGEMIEQLGTYRNYISEHTDSMKKRKDVYQKLLEYGDAHEGKIPEELVAAMLKDG